jgi:hypothetical protein
VADSVDDDQPSLFGKLSKIENRLASYDELNWKEVWELREEAVQEIQESIVTGKVTEGEDYRVCGHSFDDISAKDDGPCFGLSLMMRDRIMTPEEENYGGGTRLPDNKETSLVNHNWRKMTKTMVMRGTKRGHLGSKLLGGRREVK